MVVGSMAPDCEYFFGLAHPASHSMPGVVTFTFPLALAALSFSMVAQVAADFADAVRDAGTLHWPGAALPLVSGDQVPVDSAVAGNRHRHAHSVGRIHSPGHLGGTALRGAANDGADSGASPHADARSVAVWHNRGGRTRAGNLFGFLVPARDRGECAAAPAILRGREVDNPVRHAGDGGGAGICERSRMVRPVISRSFAARGLCLQFCDFRDHGRRGRAVRIQRDLADLAGPQRDRAGQTP